MTNRLSELRAQCAAIERIDPASPAYQKLITFLDRLDQKQLKLIAAAKIKWLSPLAWNRVKNKLGEH